MTDRRPVAVIFATAIGATIATLAGLFVVGADPSAAAQPRATLQMVAQSTVVGPSANFAVELRVAGVQGQYRVTAEVFDALDNREAFRETLRAQADLGAPIFTTEPIPIADLRSGNAGLATLKIPTRRPDQTRPNSVEIDARGVYPVRITLFDPDGDPQDQLVTHILPRRTEAGDGRPLAVGLWVDLAAPTALAPDQTRALSPAAIDRIETLVTALATHPDVAATLAPNPETLDALLRLGDDGDLLAAMRGVLAGREVVASPFVPVDEAGWFQAGLEARLTFLNELGHQTITELLGVTPQTRLVAPDPTASARTVQELRATGFDRHILPADRLEPSSDPTAVTPVDQPIEIIDAGFIGVPTFVLDPDLHNHFGSTGNPVLDAHHLLAELTVLAGDTATEARGLVLRIPADWTPDPGFLSVLLNGLDKSDFVLEPRTVSELFDVVATAQTTDPGDDTVRLEVRRRIADPSEAAAPMSGYRDDLFETATLLRSYETVVGEDSPLASPLRDLLAVSGSADVDEAERDAYLEAVGTEVRGLRQAIVGPAAETVSLTARDAKIPIVVENQLSFPVNAMVVLESNKLDFPNGSRFTVVLEPGINPLDIGVRARTSGDSTLRVSVQSPDQVLPLTTPTRIRVRSTALSGVAIIIIVIALLVLASWWARQHFGRRSDPSATAETQTGDGKAATPEGEADENPHPGGSTDPPPTPTKVRRPQP